MAATEGKDGANGHPRLCCFLLPGSLSNFGEKESLGTEFKVIKDPIHNLLNVTTHQSFYSGTFTRSFHLIVAGRQ